MGFFLLLLFVTSLCNECEEEDEVDDKSVLCVI